MKRVVVTPEKLSMAMRIWLRLAPKHIWRKSQAYERLVEAKRHDPSDAPDPHGDLAQYLTERFNQARWEITHPEPKNHG